jgi:hypothetical protein
VISDEEAARLFHDSAQVHREDIARAKAFVLAQAHRESGTNALASEWVDAQVGRLSQEVRVDSDDAPEKFRLHGQSFGLRLSFLQGVWELISAGQLLPAGETLECRPPGISLHSPHGAHGLTVTRRTCPYPQQIYLPPLSKAAATSDVDLLLNGQDCAELHEGVREALRLSVDCLRRDLYLPAIAMLAAAAEAQWVECGRAVASSTQPPAQKLRDAIDDPHSGIGKTVAQLCGHLIGKGPGSDIRRAAHVTDAQLLEAQGWTLVLREHRNALHWGKAQSFTKSYAETAALLLAAPIHFGVLEALRRASIAVAAGLAARLGPVDA